MEVLEAIRGRRSIRHYKPDPVPEELLRQVLEAARWAPSWANTQCWRFLVVTDEDLKAKVAETLTSSIPDRRNIAIPALLEAPVAIVACAEMTKAGFRNGVRQTEKGDWYMFDVALAMQNLVLAAHSLGLGTVLVGNFNDSAAKALLGVPEGFTVVAVTPLGYPAEQPKGPTRRPLEESVFQNSYGSPW